MKQIRKRLLSTLSAFVITAASVAFPVYAEDNVLTDGDVYEESAEIINDIENQELYTLDSPMILADEEYETSGTCGKNLTWNYDTESKILTVKGYGEMDSFRSCFVTPWTLFREDIVKVVLPDGLTNIGNNAFSGCVNITEIYIPDSITYIGECAFFNCNKITEIIIPDGVTYIGNSAFNRCESLIEIDFPEGVTSIEENTFRNCYSLTSFKIPSNVTTIQNDAFYDCRNLKSVIIPEGVTSIGEDAFCGCGNILEIKLPKSVTSIGKGAFWGCRSLTSFKIPDKIAVINGNTFRSCSALESVIIPDSVTDIGYNAFSGCSSLESVIIPDGVVNIGGEAFSECSKLTSVSISESVTNISGNAFIGTQWLKNKRAENPMVIINNIVVDGSTCTGDVIIPNNIVSIADYAFEYNKEITSVAFPETLKTIGYYAFSNCEKLNKADIPESVTEIQYSAFIYCTGIDSVTVRNPYCKIDSYGLPENAIVYGYNNSTAKAYAEEFHLKFVLLSGESNIKLEYSYEITPLLSFSNRYFYIKTDDPNPSHFRFADHDSKYTEKDSLITRDTVKFADVKYTDTEILRVNGGYIFYGGDNDGGDVSLQIYLNDWFDTGITYALPRLYDTADYLIDTYAVYSDFWDNMDAVQAGFSSICLYGGSYIRGELYKPGTFYYVSNSPHIDHSFYIQTPYRRKGEESLFASAVYPFRYDSLGFPSIMATVAKRLDSSSSSLVSSTNHAIMNVTYNGETRQYGGNGKGDGQGITKDKIIRYFTFDNYKENITLENIRKLLDEYDDMDIPDDFSHTDQLTWSDVADTVGNGSWISIVKISSVWGGASTGYSYLYKADDNNMYAKDDMGDGASQYMGNSMRYASDTWVDGRYVDSYEKFVPGEKFENHQESNIILFDITIPVLEYDRQSCYNSNTGEYEYNYKNVKVSEVVRNVRYLYNKNENIWTADYNTMEITNSRIEDISAMVEQGLIPEKYLKTLQLTYEDVVALNVDRNTNISPQQYYIYDQTAEPGTKVILGDANNDGKVSIADAVMLQNWLLGSGDLTCWRNVDLCKDERIDVFDFCLLKRLLIENS